MQWSPPFSLSVPLPPEKLTTLEGWMHFVGGVSLEDIIAARAKRALCDGLIEWSRQEWEAR